MKKLSVLLFSVILLGFSFYGLSNNSYYIQIFMNLSESYNYARIALAIILSAYVFLPQIRIYLTKILLSTGGILLLSLGLVSAVSPTLLGHSNGYILIGDTLTLIEGGILAVVLSTELSARKSRFPTKNFLYIKLLLASRSKKLIYPTQLASKTSVAQPLSLRS